MKKILILLGFGTFWFSSLAHAVVYVPFLEGNAWGDSYWKHVRATCYPRGGKSAAGVLVQYALTNQVGTAAIPDWIAAGSLIRIWSKNGIFTYMATDKGHDVSTRKAAMKSAKNSAQRREWVIDFCAPKEYWPERINVEILPYAYWKPFEKLSPKEKKWLLEFAQGFISH